MHAILMHSHICMLPCASLKRQHAQAQLHIARVNLSPSMSDSHQHASGSRGGCTFGQASAEACVDQRRPPGNKSCATAGDHASMLWFYIVHISQGSYGSCQQAVQMLMMRLAPFTRRKPCDGWPLQPRIYRHACMHIPYVLYSDLGAYINL